MWTISNARANLSGVAGLNYSQNIGCAASRTPGPGQCEGREEFAVPHRYRFPQPHEARLFVCEHHAREHPGAEPLTAEDRALIAGRRARRAAVLARVTVGPYAVPGGSTGAAGPG